MDKIDEALAALELQLALLIAFMLEMVRSWGITLAVMVEVSTLSSTGRHGSRERASRADHRRYGFQCPQHSGLVLDAPVLTARMRSERMVREAIQARRQQFQTALSTRIMASRARMAGAL